MAAFSVNQVRQLYVVNAKKENLAGLTTPGDVLVVEKGGDVYFQYVGALGDIMRSDLIKVKNITYAKATKADDIAIKLKGYTLTLDSNVNGGNPVAGQDYLLRLAFREYIGLSEADQYQKYGMVHATSGMTADTFYKELAHSLAENIAADKYCKPVDIFVHSARTTSKGGFDSKGLMKVTPTTVDNGKTDSSNSYYDGTSAVVKDIDSIIISEAQLPWYLGTMPQGVIPFAVQPTDVLVDGDRRLWGTVEPYDTGTVLPEGQLIADLEYFAMGERGDQYRMKDWPNVIYTKYMVDPSKKYDVLNIHYYFQGDGISVQKSEKDIQIACIDDGSHTVANAVIGAFNTATGLSVETLS